MNRKLIPLLTLAAAWLALAPTASASPRSDAEQALAEAQALLGGGAQAYSSAADGSRNATLALRDLALGIDDLGKADRRTARRILARPDQGNDQDNFGPEAAASPICDTNFCVHWGTRARSAPSPKDSNINGVPDFVEEVLAAAARSYDVENTALGWRDPVSDGNKGARNGVGNNGQTDIFLTGLQKGLFGYATTDLGEKGRKQAGYLVLDNDYAGFSGVPLDLMRVTMAHEYNHILQFGYDVFQDGWMFESTATFMEDYVYADINDYVNFLPPFIESSFSPLAETDQQAFKLYGSGVWNHFIAGRFGPEVVRRAWEVSPSVKPSDFAVSAYDRSIKDAGGPGFSQEFVRFAAATAEWRSTTDFPDPALYPDMKRVGKLGRKTKKGALDHTGYALFKVKSKKNTVKLKVRGKKGVRSGLALVGRIGPVDGGTVVTQMKYLPKGGKGNVRLTEAGRFSRITAVVVNADGRVKGNSRRYKHDKVKYATKLR